jgi:Rhodopirellula transposase DDE domain
MTREEQVELIRHKYAALAPLLNERTRRCWAATEASALGYGGISLVAEALGIARGTIYAGGGGSPSPGDSGGAQADSQNRRWAPETHGERSGVGGRLESAGRAEHAGRSRVPVALGTCKSTTRLAQELRSVGHPLSQRRVCSLLRAQHYSLQAQRKTREGSTHPDRDAQFQYLNASVKQFQRAKQPVISVDTKKKELVGNFRNPGREWQPKRTPE